MTTHETIEFDVLFVGGGPANLCGAIRLMQLAAEKGRELEVAIIDKGAAIGSHAISGAVMNPVAIAELYPDFLEQGFPVEQTVRGDGFLFLTKNRSFKMPLVPRQMHNTGFPIVSLSKVCRWLGDRAEALGINIFPGFDGKEILLADDGITVTGVRTGDKGLDKDGKPKPNFEPGIDLLAKVTVLGEGARGSLMKSLAGKLPIRSKTGCPRCLKRESRKSFSSPKTIFLATAPSTTFTPWDFPWASTRPAAVLSTKWPATASPWGFCLPWVTKIHRWTFTTPSCASSATP
jgi:electron-transferring-flavoprotein dehydrogenase